MKTEWTRHDEDRFQEIRQQRNGVPFADQAAEAAYQAERNRRDTSTPSAEMLDAQLDEQCGRTSQYPGHAARGNQGERR